MMDQQRRTLVLAFYGAFFFLVVNMALTTHLENKYTKKTETKEASSALLFLSEDGPQKEPKEGSLDLLLPGDDDEVDFCWIIFCFTQPLGVFSVICLTQCVINRHD